MNDLFDLLFGSGHTPIKRETTIHVTFDGEGNPQIEPVDGAVMMLSEQGSIDKLKTSRDRFFACGCAVDTSEIGGQCRSGACRKVSCLQHHGRCSVLSCSRPLCLECSLWLEENFRICRRCYKPAQRQLARQQLTRALLRPFSG